MNEIMNLNDEKTKNNIYIFYECSRINGYNKNVFRIYNSLFELKDYCISFYNVPLNNCIIN